MTTAAPEPYSPLRPSLSVEAEIAAFISEELAPALEEIQRLVRNPEHKAELFEIGHRAIALRMRVSKYLAKAKRELEVQTSSAYQGLWETSKATAMEVGARSQPADLVKAKVRVQCGTISEAVDLLGYYRNDLDALQSFVQTGIRSMRDEELGQMDGAGAASGLWKGK